MNVGIYTLASGGMGAFARLEAVTQNLANVGTTGYKALRPVFEAGGESGGVPVDPRLGRAVGRGLSVSTTIDFSPGPVRATGNPLDVAITGSEFFVVRAQAGERYTRQGNFRIDPEGYLVTAAGDRVRGDGGDIRADGGDVQIAPDGTVRVDGAARGRLKLVRFGDPPGLVPAGEGLLEATPGAVPTDVEQAAVRLVPESLEGSNVDAVTALVELVDVTRGYESYMNAMRRLDDVAGRSITDLGRVG